jgi:catechol 2,3-dioxygenase-like lactoylglutathione lyase family enzyme
MQLHHVALVASSEEHADRFYQGILKLNKIKTSQLTGDLAVKIFGVDIACPFVLYSDDHMAFEIFITDRIPAVNTPLNHVCLQVDDREAFMAACRAEGAEVILIPRGDYHLCFVKDLDGNLFEIK